MTYFDQVNEAAQYLREMLGELRPAVGVVLGSGLGAVANTVKETIVVPYRDIPNFPQSDGGGPLGARGCGPHRQYAGDHSAGARALLRRLLAGAGHLSDARAGQCWACRRWC